MADPDPEADLWHYAVTLYGGEGVSGACLRLQDECGCDVPVLLFALWLASTGRRLDTPAMAAVEARIGDWRREVVHPLRAVRRRMKSGPYPAPGTATEPLREAVKSAELGAEKLELACLAGFVADMAPAGPGPGPFRENLAAALAFYARDRAVPGEPVEILLAAAARRA